MYQARRQDLAAGGQKPKKKGQKPDEGATFLKYSIGCMQQPGGPNVKWGGTDFKWGAGHHCPSRWRRPCHVPLQHFDRWACTKISDDKKVEENNKNIFTNKHDFENNIHRLMYCINILK